MDEESNYKKLSLRSSKKRKAALKACELMSEIKQEGEILDGVGVLDEVKVEDIPMWCSDLKNVKILNENTLNGEAESLNIAYKVIENHCRTYLCTYIKSHHSGAQNNQRKKLHTNRILWDKQNGDQIPYSVLSTDRLTCSFGMKYKVKGDKGVQDEIYIKRCYKEVQYSGCTAKIVIKGIVRYPGHCLPQNVSRSLEKEVIAKLQEQLKNSNSTEQEEVYIVSISLPEVHNHPFTGKARHIDSRVSEEIKNCVMKGVKSPKAIKKVINSFVSDITVTDHIKPQECDRAFYPQIRDINNLVYEFSKHCKGEQQTCSELPSVNVSQAASESSLDSREPRTLQEAVEKFCVGDIYDEPEWLILTPINFTN